MPIQTKSTAKYPVKSAEEVLHLVLTAKEIVFADIETTGFGVYDDITEIGAIRVNVDSGQVLDKFSTFVHLKLQKKIPAKIEELTGITTDMLRDAPNMETVLPAFQTFIGESVLSFHNAVFDWRMLQQKYALLGRRLTNEVVCTVKLFRYLHPGKPSGLDDVTTFYGTPIVGHHRAYVDCKWTAACYRKMRDELMTLQEKQQLTLLPPSSPATPVHELTFEELVNTCTVYRISGWRKGSRMRIYCTTNIADFYYDMTAHVWNVSKQKTDDNLNIDLLAKFILNKINMDQAQFEACYAPS